MAKRVFLFLVTNLVVVVTLSLILSVLGVGRYVGPGGQLRIVPLAVFCFIWGMGGAFISLQMSRWIAKRSLGVTLIDGRSGQSDLDWLHNTVANLTRQANLPQPEVGVYDSPEVNAFATGPSRKRSLVAVSTGLLRNMSRAEIEGVLGHEIAHIQNGDMVTMALVQGVMNAFVMFFARVIGMLVRQAVDRRIANLVYYAVVFLLEIGLGILGSLVTMWFSREREYRADRGWAALAGRDSMIAALQRLLASKDRIDTTNTALATFKIAGVPGWLSAFSTHPPLESRIAALQAFQG